MKMVSKFSILYVDNGRILFLAETWIADEKRAQPESISYRQAHDSLTCNSKAYYDNKSPYCRWPPPSRQRLFVRGRSEFARMVALAESRKTRRISMNRGT
jgi:hypothetical protein